MRITLTQAQETLVRRAVETGRLSSASDAVTEALLLWEEQERVREAGRDAVRTEERAKILGVEMIEGDDVEILRQFRADRVPHQRMLRTTVDQHQRLS